MRTSATGKRASRSSSDAPAGSRRGFTLIELLVVIVIIGITVGYIGPRIFSGLFATTMDRTARDVTAMVQLARSRAVTHHATYFIRFDMDGERIALYPMPASEKEEPRMESERRLPEGIDLRSVKTPYQPEKDRGDLDFKVTPEGVVEQGVIYVEGPLGKVYTLVVKPFSGFVEVNDHYVEVSFG